MSRDAPLLASAQAISIVEGPQILARLGRRRGPRASRRDDGAVKVPWQARQSALCRHSQTQRGRIPYDPQPLRPEEYELARPAPILSIFVPQHGHTP